MYTHTHNTRLPPTAEDATELRPSKKRLGTRWARYPFSWCRSLFKSEIVKMLVNLTLSFNDDNVIIIMIMLLMIMIIITSITTIIIMIIIMSAHII